MATVPNPTEFDPKIHTPMTAASSVFTPSPSSTINPVNATRQQPASMATVPNPANPNPMNAASSVSQQSSLSTIDPIRMVKMARQQIQTELNAVNLALLPRDIDVIREFCEKNPILRMDVDYSILVLSSRFLEGEKKTLESMVESCNSEIAGLNSMIARLQSDNNHLHTQLTLNTTPERPTVAERMMGERITRLEAENAQLKTLIAAPAVPKPTMPNPTMSNPTMPTQVADRLIDEARYATDRGMAIELNLKEMSFKTAAINAGGYYREPTQHRLLHNVTLVPPGEIAQQSNVDYTVPQAEFFSDRVYGQQFVEAWKAHPNPAVRRDWANHLSAFRVGLYTPTKDMLTPVARVALGLY